MFVKVIDHNMRVPFFGDTVYNLHDTYNIVQMNVSLLCYFMAV